MPHPRIITLMLAALLAFGFASRASRAQDPPGDAPAPGRSLRFYGHGLEQLDRVKIRIDDPLTVTPGPPADVGATDFTIEFWLRGFANENAAAEVACGENVAWINGNILVDRDRYNQDRKYGISVAGGKVVFGVSGDGTGDRTICGTTPVLDGRWHHVAVERRRSDGRLWLSVDGAPDAQADGPDGDVSYPDDGLPGHFCDGPCIYSDPFIVLGAEKHDAGPAYPSFAGWLDELRISTKLRYRGAFAFSREPVRADAATAGLYHFDEGAGDVVHDTSGAEGGPSDGIRRFGGDPPGPAWSKETPFAPNRLPRARRDPTGGAIAVPAGRATGLDVLANDSDADFDPLRIFRIVTRPDHGTATITPAGRIRYRPDAGYTGRDTLRYRITDGRGGFAEAHVAIRVVSLP